MRRWHHHLTHLHIHIDWSRNVSWKFAKLQSVITSLFFNRFSSGFHCYVWKIFTLSSEIKLNLLWSSSIKWSGREITIFFITDNFEQRMMTYRSFSLECIYYYSNSKSRAKEEGMCKFTQVKACLGTGIVMKIHCRIHILGNCYSSMSSSLFRAIHL